MKDRTQEPDLMARAEERARAVTSDVLADPRMREQLRRNREAARRLREEHAAEERRYG